MRLMTTAAVLIAFLSSVACTPLTERQRDSHEYGQLDFEARFIAFSRHCQARGGIIVVERSGRLGKRGMPRRTDSYRCM